MSDWSGLRERLYIDSLRWAPKGAFAHTVGWLSRRKVPGPLRSMVYKGFARRAGIDMDELDRPVEAFDRFDDFFTRPLRAGLRPVAPGEEEAVAPCDGVLSEVGKCEGGRMLQCKGRDYTVGGLLTDETEARGFIGGAYATIYLAPHNYHRVHAPTSGSVIGYRHVPGALFPVNKPSVERVAGLFSINERLITYLEGPLGKVAIVMVAAMGVGHITVRYDSIGTRPAMKHRSFHYAEARKVSKGDELATFHLGSTVILLFQPGRVNLSGLERGQPIRMGQRLGGPRPGGDTGRSGEVAA